jgi:hypothetical protein
MKPQEFHASAILPEIYIYMYYSEKNLKAALETQAHVAAQSLIQFLSLTLRTNCTSSLEVSFLASSVDFFSEMVPR